MAYDLTNLTGSGLEVPRCSR